jgi:integrase
MKLTDLIDDFLRERARAGRRPSTLRVYRGRLAPLREHLGARDAGEISRGELLDVLHKAAHDASGSRKANATIKLTLTLVGMLQSFALDEGAIAEAWLKPKDLKKPKPRRRERVATPEETALLLAEMTPAYRRLYQAYRFTGARRGELVAAKIEDLQGLSPSRSIVLADHKTSDEDGRARVIHLGPQADAIVSEAIAGRTFGRIFLNERGKAWNIDTVTRTFRRLRRRLGLDEALTIHSTRHEFASAVVAAHGLQVAQELLGHADITTTQRYSHLLPDHLRSCLDGLYETPQQDAA